MTPKVQAQLEKLCAAAFDNEYNEDQSLAMSLHEQAISGLRQLESASVVDKERRKMAQKQLKFHQTRLQLLRQTADSSQLRRLPTTKTAQYQLLDVGKASISMDELRLSQFQQSQKQNPNAEIPANIVHLLATTVPLYTPTLTDGAPSVFDIHLKMEMNAYFGGHHLYIKAKDPATQQTLYVLRLLKRRRWQITSAACYRAAEFGKQAIAVSIVPIDMRKVGKHGGGYGRNLVFNNGLSVVEEKMDRQHKPSWEPRRFCYGGRRFVWRKSAGSFMGMTQDLHEITRVWPQPGSKTGKMLDEVVPERLSWGHSKARMSSLAQVSIKGGIDQYFMEYILASQMTRMAVMLHGHD